ncbi:MAG: nitronate monooxygenase [Amylibacter sp.]|nr:nitronate monooxygenase [Amylibacter sp.]
MTIWPDTRLCQLLDIEHPIIQAPMAGASTAEMAAVVGNAGGMGSLGCAMMDADGVLAVAAKTRELSNCALNLNFFCHKVPVADDTRARAARTRLQPWFDKLDAGDMPDVTESNFPFNAQICEAVLEASPKVASFHFGLPDADLVQKLKDAGIIILSSATTAAEARWLENHGADAIIAQGAEAGGHNGWFLPRTGEVAGTMALVPRVVDAVDCPVIAAGGIADGRGIAAAFALGAAGVQIGTAFLATPESAVSDIHKQTLAAATGDDTQFSQAFSGRDARTIVNDYARDMADVKDWPDFPLMNTVTAPLRAASAKAGLPDTVSLWAGQGAGLVKAGTTREVFETLVKQAKVALGK